MPLTSPRVATSRGSRNKELLEQPSLPIAGIIRAGIQVMVPQAAKVPELVQLYERGVAAGVSFKDILREMQHHPKCPKRGDRPIWPLRPTNVPYFTVRQTDFPGIPGAADKLLALYGEIREGDTEKRLYSFPVVFPTDIMDVVFKEEFAEYNASQARVHWSQMSTDGVLKCVQYSPLEAQGKNARKVFDTRRQTEIRCDCDPDGCDFFGAGKCAHYGTLYFWIPGVRSDGVIRLTFKSVYTKLAVFNTLTRIHDQVLGRISGLYRGEPIFRISKQRQSVARNDREAGKTERSDQWITHLSSPGVNLIEALSGKCEQQEAIEGPRKALEAPPADDDDEVPPQQYDGDMEPQYDEDPEPVQQEPKLSDDVRQLRKQVNDVRLALGWDDEEFGLWVSELFPENSAKAMRDEDCLKEVLKTLERAASKPTEDEIPL